MKYMAFNDSEILREFGRIMQEQDGLTKMAQMALTPQQQAAWAKVLAGHGPGTKVWKEAAELLKGNKEYMDLMARAQQIYYGDESANDALAWKKFLDTQAGPAMAKQPAPAAPAPAPMAGQPAMPKGAELDVVEQHEKTADMKAYDVMPKEDMVQEAHPKPAMVSGDLVENLNEQQDADKAVAEKSAKEILNALYKLAKQLKAENNEEAYKLVKETFLDISSSLKK